MKIFFLLPVISLIISCSGNEKADPDSNPVPGDTTVVENNAGSVGQPEDPDAQKGLALIAKNDCLTCHKVLDTNIGPAYLSIAEKFRGNTTVIDTLADRIIKGSSGHWGTVPMTPHPGLSMDEARLMVKYVLSVKE